MTSFTAAFYCHFCSVELKFLPLYLVGGSEFRIPGSVILSESLPSSFLWHFLPSSLFWNLGFSFLCYIYLFICLENMLWSRSVHAHFGHWGIAQRVVLPSRSAGLREGALLKCASLCCVSFHLPHAVLSSLRIQTMSFEDIALTYQHMANSRLLRDAPSDCRWSLEVDV